METKQLAATSRFFKVMMPSFHQKLKLPPAVSKELRNKKSQTAILQSRIGKWEINLCRNCEEDDGLICFKQGWPEFVDGHALTFGDFVVFEHTGELHFNVFVFGSSACEKEFGVEPNEEREEASAPTTRLPKKDDESPYFVKRMLPCHATKMARVNIPMQFVRANNLRQKNCVILRDSGGREWPVKLRVERINGVRICLRMHRGWHDFYASNGLKEGDVCVFKLTRGLQTPTNIFFDVQISPANAMTDF